MSFPLVLHAMVGGTCHSFCKGYSQPQPSPIFDFSLHYSSGVSIDTVRQPTFAVPQNALPTMVCYMPASWCFWGNLGWSSLRPFDFHHKTGRNSSSPLHPLSSLLRRDTSPAVPPALVLFLFYLFALFQRASESFCGFFV